MNFNVYQKKANSTSKNTEIFGDKLLYPVLGLSNESGEFLGKIKKVFRDNNGIIDEKTKKDLGGELGDILWYIAETCTQLDLDLESVAMDNIEKLLSRKARGKIGGSGDNR